MPLPDKLKENMWKPGKSGNPGGRPKGIPAKVRQLTNNGEDVLKFLADVLQGKIKGTTRDRIECAKILLDRGFGKAVETQVVMQMDQKNAEAVENLAALADAQLEQLARTLKPVNKPPELAPIMQSKTVDAEFTVQEPDRIFVQEKDRISVQEKDQ